MKVSEYNKLIYPELDEWQKKAAGSYFKMGMGAWPDELHGLIYRLEQKYGMCGSLRWEACKMYVWLRSQEFMDYQEKKYIEVKKQPPVFKCGMSEPAPESKTLEFQEKWGFKEEVKKRWKGKK